MKEQKIRKLVRKLLKERRLPGFVDKTEPRTTIKMDKIQPSQDVLDVVQAIRSEIPEFTGYDVVNLQVRYPEFHEDVKNLRKACELLDQMVGKIEKKAKKGVYEDED